MRIVVFGATGGTGRQLIQQAIAAGHQVVAYARDPSKIDAESERLTVVKGDLTDEASIENAVKGADAVISLLGPRGGSHQKPITRGTQNIVNAMKTSGVKRLIASSTLSVRDPADRPSPTASLLVNIIKTTMHAAYQDITGAAEAVRLSGLDWTIARIATLNNGPKTGEVRTGYVGTGRVGLSISRADLAAFTLKQVEDRRYLRQAPAVSN